MKWSSRGARGGKARLGFDAASLRSKPTNPRRLAVWGLFYIGVENDAAGHVIEQQGSPRGQGPPRFGCSELAQQADEPQAACRLGFVLCWGKNDAAAL